MCIVSNKVIFNTPLPYAKLDRFEWSPCMTMFQHNPSTPLPPPTCNIFSFLLTVTEPSSAFISPPRWWLTPSPGIYSTPWAQSRLSGPWSRPVGSRPRVPSSSCACLKWSRSPGGCRKQERKSRFRNTEEKRNGTAAMMMITERDNKEMNSLLNRLITVPVPD